MSVANIIFASTKQSEKAAMGAAIELESFRRQAPPHHTFPPPLPALAAALHCHRITVLLSCGAER